MSEIRPADVAVLRPLRPSMSRVHLLDAMPGAVHLGAFDEDALVGALSAYRVSPDGFPNGQWLWLHGPFGAHGDALIAALVERTCGGVTLWSDGPTPGLQASEEGRWTLQVPVPPPAPGEGDYSAHNIRVLEGLEAVRKRPGMYFGGVGERGLQELLWEVVSNVLDEHLAGHCGQLWIDRAPDGAWIVADDGRGIPVDADPLVVQRVLLQLHAGSTFPVHDDRHPPHVHAGLHGVGLAAVNAVSELLVLTVDRASGSWEQIFRYGLPITELQRLGDSTRRGTTIRLRPDRTIFEGDLPVEAITPRLIELAHLNPGLQITLQGRNLSRPGGLHALARSLAEGPITDTLWVQGRHADVDVRLAVVWAPGPARVEMFANQLHLSKGGTPVEAAEAVLADRGPCVVVGNVMLQAPHFLGRTREALGSPEAGEAVRVLLSEALAARAG